MSTPIDRFEKCLQHETDCFAYWQGECRALTDTDFKDRPCPFFKTNAEYAEGLKRYKYNREYPKKGGGS